MKFVHALNVAVVYIGMEKFGNAQTVTTQRKTKEEKRLLITGYIPVVRRILSVPQILSINVNIKMYIFDHLRMYIFAILPLDRYIFLSDKIFL